MSQVTYCQEPDCLGLEVRPEDRHCPWCGSALLDLSVGFWAKRGAGWEPLDPPVLFHGERRPSLQLRVKHTGQTGTLEVRPDSVRSSAPWYEVAALQKPVQLHPGEESSLETSRFQKLEDEERHYEARVSVEVSGLRREVALQVVPLPAFDVALQQDEVTLLGGQPVEIPVVLTLIRGETTILQPPSFSGDWAELAWGPEHRFPVNLSTRDAKVLHGTLRIRSDRVADSPRMSGAVTIPCTGREASPPQEILEVRFHESPELVVDPFRNQPRHDWTAVRGATDRDELELTLQNGYQRHGTRAPLEIRGLAIGDPTGGVPGVELATPELLPRTLDVGEDLRLRLRIRPGTVGEQLRTFTLAFTTNELRPRVFHLGVQVLEPRPYEGWLVVDLGTTNTCAVLVDEQRLRHLVDLENPKSSPEGTQTLRSALAYRRLSQAERDYTVGWTVWKGYLDAARSTVLAAKRRAGDRRFRYDIVPLRDPEQVVRVPVQDVLCDLYRHVVQRAGRHLASSGRPDLLLTKVVLTHPSRFSSHAIEDLQQAAQRALAEQARFFGVEPGPVELRSLHEPVAAALSFLNDPGTHARVHDRERKDEVLYHVLVYDAGGGTVDVTLVQVQSKRTEVAGAGGPTPEASLDGALERILENGRGADLLREVLLDQVRRRCLQELERRFGEGAACLPGPDAARASKGNQAVLASFVGSLVATDPGGVVLADDASAWEGLQRNPVVNRQVNLQVMREERLEDVVFPAGEIWPRLAEVRRSLVQRVETGPDAARLRPDAWQYRVRARVLAASGHARFGGEDMTEAVRDLLVERLTEGARKRFGPTASVPVEAHKVPLHQDLAARSNGALLLVWAEQVKVALSEGKDLSTLPDPEGEARQVHVAVGDEIRRPGFRDLVGESSWPDRAAVDARVGPSLEETIRIARSLLEARGVSAPEYVLGVGKCSRWPRIRELLGRAFPDSKAEFPDQAKECVVLGAALVSRSGPQVLKGAGVRVNIVGSGEMTTSRLGIQAEEGARPTFLQVTPAGAEVPEDGRVDRCEPLGFLLGKNELRILENTGVEDRLQLADGSRNPDIQEIRTLRFTIPEEVDDVALEQGAVEFLVSPKLHLSVKVLVPGLEPFVFDTIEGADYGVTY